MSGELIKRLCETWAEMQAPAHPDSAVAFQEHGRLLTELRRSLPDTDEQPLSEKNYVRPVCGDPYHRHSGKCELWTNSKTITSENEPKYLALLKAAQHFIAHDDTSGYDELEAAVAALSEKPSLSDTVNAILNEWGAAGYSSNDRPKVQAGILDAVKKHRTFASEES